MERTLLILAVLLAGLTTSTPIRVRDGPLIPGTSPALSTTTPTGSGNPATRTPAPRPTATPRPTPAPTPTTWPISPAVLALGHDLVDYYRIENGWRCGGSAHDCMLGEPDALILARIAIGEAPSDVNDQVYVIWLIRLRAALGFKNARFQHGWCGTDWCYVPGRWGQATTIVDEALCVGGCQFSPARVAQNIYYPCGLSAASPMRKMLCPSDNQLGDFDVAYRAAVAILAAPLSDFPVALRGYDNFRSPSITGPGQHNRVGGLTSAQFWPAGNIWRDEFLDDNIFWGLETVTPTPRPVARPEIQSTRTPPGLHDGAP